MLHTHKFGLARTATSQYGSTLVARLIGGAGNTLGPQRHNKPSLLGPSYYQPIPTPASPIAVAGAPLSHFCFLVPNY